MFAHAGRYEVFFQTRLLIHKILYTNQSYDGAPVQSQSQADHIYHTCAVYKHLHTILVCRYLNDTLIIIYFPLKCPRSQKGFTKHHEVSFWILARKRKANINIFTKHLTFSYFLPNQKLLNKKFPEVSKTLSQLNVTKHPYFDIYLNFKILQSFSYLISNPAMKPCHTV